MLVHQLAGLLAAGRTPHELFSDAAALIRSRSARPDGGESHAGDSAQELDGLLLPVLEAAAQAASLGLSPAPVFRSAAAAGRTHPPAGGSPAPQAALAVFWEELAACLTVAERSGAPLAAVLARYAAQLERGLDVAAARETALAGPRATMRLLTWLPVAGIALGYLLGTDPLAALLGSPLGWAAGSAGLLLALAGRVWSRRLVARAAAP